MVEPGDMQTVAAFTDTYLPTVNGVTYTVRTWRDCWERRDGLMGVVYPDDDGYEPGVREFPVSSVPFPFYPGFRFGLPDVPAGVRGLEPDLVHAHTPFSLGLAARRFALDRDLPLVVSYHPPAREYAGYISDAFAGVISRVADRYERWFFEQADAVIVLGHDQHHDEETLSAMLAEEGIDCEVERASAREPDSESVLSTGSIIERVCRRRC